MPEATAPHAKLNPLPELPDSASAWALFLDVDGTLLEIAPTPDQVRVPATLGPTLVGLETHLGGAVALISGRTIANIDALLAPYRFATAGVHGAELRMADTIRTIDADPARLDPLRQAFRDFTLAHAGTRWEDKRYAVTLHHRQNPEAGELARTLAQTAAHELGDLVEVLQGKMVVEVRFRAATKAHAVETFLASPPFATRVPVYLGDDRTDEDAFEWVNAHQGISILVGAPRSTHANYGLDSVTDVHRWIDRFARHLQSLH